MVRARVMLAAMLLSACSQNNQVSPGVARQLLPAASGADAGEDPQSREALFAVEPAAVWGDELPRSALAVQLEAASIFVAGRKLPRDAAAGSEQLLKAIGHGAAVLLGFDDERYLAEVAELLAALSAARCEVWLRHPDAPVAYRVNLVDNAQFQRWLDEPKPGKIRVIQRADGFELQTNIGKVAGADPNGPTVPTRGGKLDVARLRRALQLLKQRFPKADDSCLVPSYGTELHSIARALSAYYQGAGKRMFAGICLVYPPAPLVPAGASR